MVDDCVEGDLERRGVPLHLCKQKSPLEGGQGGGGEFVWVSALTEPAASGHCVQAQADARFPSEERCGDVSARLVEGKFRRIFADSTDPSFDNHSTSGSWASEPID